MCMSYTQCTVRLCQLHSQTLKPSFLRPPHTHAGLERVTPVYRLEGCSEAPDQKSDSVLGLSVNCGAIGYSGPGPAGRRPRPAGARHCLPVAATLG